METDSRDQFILLLEKKYGTWNKTTSRFGAAPFGRISKDLNIGASQFSKLIYGTATEGMYERSIANIRRLITNEHLKSDLQKIQEANDSLQQIIIQQKIKIKRLTLFFPVGMLVFVILCVLIYGFLNPQKVKKNIQLDRNTHPLSPFFDQEYTATFNSPYLDISEVQNFCPASAYEGVWSLDRSYKLPLPGSKRPGLYYYGKSADVRMKVARYDPDPELQGHLLSGYEYLVNEIWVDTEMMPLSPTYFDPDLKQFTEAFEALDFEQDNRFKKVATIYSFFVDRFEIDSDTIKRYGEPAGRYAVDVDQELADQFEVDVKYILEDVIGDLTTTSCSAILNPYPNPNDLVEGESILRFDCSYTIDNENLGIGGGYPYQKGYKLVHKNYADNLFCRD